MALNKYDVIIIGSGLGSLLCGNILSKEGMNVCIIEKNKVPGGALQSFKRKGVIFDTGIHYIGGLAPGQNLNQYFRYFGLTGNLKFSRLNQDRFDVIAFDDGEYPLAQGFDNFTEQLLPYFPGCKEPIESYLSTIKRIAGSFPLYNLEIPGAHSEQEYQSTSAFDFFSAITSGIRDPGSGIRLQAILAGNNFLYAGSKNKTPVYIPALINHSFISSAWRPVGGSSRIADLLIKSVIGAGGTFIKSTEVSKIQYIGKTFHVSDNSGELFSSEFLISGIHPAKTLELLDPGLLRKAYSARVRNLGNTTGSFAVYIVLKKETFGYLDYNYYYHSTKDVWDHPVNDTWPANYMLITPDSDETGKFAKSLVIMTTMDSNDLKKWEGTFTGRRGDEYAEFKMKKASQLLAMAEKRFPHLQSKIDCIEISTPLTWRDFTGTPGGSMYGIQKDFNHPLETQVLPRTSIPKLLFTGQNINLHGVMGVTAGAVMTCGEIIGTGNLINKIRHA